MPEGQAKLPPLRITLQQCPWPQRYRLFLDTVASHCKLTSLLEEQSGSCLGNFPARVNLRYFTLHLVSKTVLIVCSDPFRLPPEHAL